MKREERRMRNEKSRESSRKRGRVVIPVLLSLSFFLLFALAACQEPIDGGGRIQVAKPALAQSEFAYSGNPHTVTLNPANTTAYTLGGDVTKTDAGDYTAVVTLTADYEWADGTTEPLNLPWKIVSVDTCGCEGIAEDCDCGEVCGCEDCEAAPAAPGITTEALPDGAINVPYSFTLAAAGTAPVFWSIESGDLPDGLALAGTGLISGTPAAAGTFTFTVKAENDTGSDTKDFSIIITSSIVPPGITTASLPDGAVNTPYSQTLAASGTAPVWSISGGSLPGGLTLNPQTGVISGTPDAAGAFTFTVKAENAAGIDTEQLSIAVSRAKAAKPVLAQSEFAYSGSPHTVTLNPANPAAYTLGGDVTKTDAGDYTAEVTLTANYEWADGTDALLNLPWKIISGTCECEGVEEDCGCGEGCGCEECEPAPAAPSITTASLPDGAVGIAYSRMLAATGTAPISWSIQSGSLPDGLTLYPETGLISGTPDVENTFTFTVKAENGIGSASKQLSIKIDPEPVPPSITTAALDDAPVDRRRCGTLEAEGTAPAWSIDSGSLPDGLILNPQTGVISGTPAAADTFTFTVKAVNLADSDTKQLSIEIGKGTKAFPPHEAITGAACNAVLADVALDEHYAWADPAEAVSVGTADYNAVYTDPSGNYLETSGTISVTAGHNWVDGFCALCNMVNISDTYFDTNPDTGIADAIITKGLAAADAVTVIGERSGVSLTLNIPSGKTVIWAASAAGTENQNAITLSGGTGTLDIQNGTITAAGSQGVAIYNPAACLISISGTDTLITSENNSETGGTIRLANTGAKLQMTGGTVTNTIRTVISNTNSTQTDAVVISGGTIESDIGIAIRNAAGGLISISGDALITSASTTAALATIVLGNANARLEMTGGTVRNTSADASARAINNTTSTHADAVKISGGTVISTSAAIRNVSNSVVRISGDALITSASTTAASGTIELASTSARLEMTGGTVRNTAASANARAIYNADSTSADAIKISGGTVGAMDASGVGTIGVAIWNNNTGVITISDDAVIRSADVTAAQGTIVLGGTGTATTPRLVMTGGTVTNTANASTDARAAAIHNLSYGSVQLDGGTISGVVRLTATANIVPWISMSGNTMPAFTRLDLRGANATLATVEGWFKEKRILRAVNGADPVTPADLTSLLPAIRFMNSTAIAAPVEGTAIKTIPVESIDDYINLTGESRGMMKTW